MSQVVVEVCAGSMHDCRAAEQSGANRIELNTALSLGGLTPSIGLLRLAKQHVSLPVIAMGRPRPGNFCYDDAEIEQLESELKLLSENGADGFAIGITDSQGAVDVPQCRALMSPFADDSLEWVFHRAIDLSPDWRKCLGSLIELGFDRVLTSGQARTAIEGVDCIRQMVEEFGEQIEIVAGSGIGPDNALSLIESTGCRQIHGSFSINHHRLENEVADFGRLDRTDPERVRQTVEQIRAC